MKNLVFFLIVLNIFCFASYAQDMQVNTGAGYIKDTEGNIVCKYELPNGKHPLKDGYIYVELPDKESLKGVKVYIKPKTDDELKEEKIQKEMQSILREQAVNSLMAKGEIK